MLTSSDDSASASINDYYVQGLELGVLLSVAAEDMDAFARNIQQLQPLYNTTTTTTARKYHVLGLNLMSLLVDNRLSEFHSELELLAMDTTALSNAYIQFPVSLEQKMMVGVYDEVLAMSIPDPSYRFFMEQMVRTVRDSIADCMEVSYHTLSISEAVQIMRCTTEQELHDYITSARDDWIVAGTTITFQPDAVVDSSGTSSGTNVPSQHDIPSMTWIEQSLAYATEMELII
jgi:26S proteasome regulatory subunit N12